MITTHDKLAHYLTRIMNQKPIESSFKARINDNLNAEVRGRGIGRRLPF
jgi:activating signal cointegrator complex subunit 3